MVIEKHLWPSLGFVKISVMVIQPSQPHQVKSGNYKKQNKTFTKSNSNKEHFAVHKFI